jgi:hypothetical protein
MKYSKGVMWLDDTRIPFVDDNENTKRSISGHQKVYGSGAEIHYLINTDTQQDRDKGRFTPNLLVCDDMLNDGVITQYNKTREDKGNYLGGHRKEYVGTTDNDIVKQIKGQFFSDKGSNSRYYDLDKWFDKVIDEIQ